ncbi:tellurite resistance/C4-dicarboxylate transporter family protein [Bacillus dakarensis]|uniref:tellurite resistance/C4-dicarboxylate transporter family protein n=1 Tax=Robertmurraya dakarensis TaxID=1926278 RepID=UPI001F298DEC|nr:tellurite resistance/C4-dicarboxylate transporter family protein [Bacillus dakarensis]
MKKFNYGIFFICISLFVYSLFELVLALIIQKPFMEGLSHLDKGTISLILSAFLVNILLLILTFLKLEFAALTPPYWINMGAVAITTLAGSTLILHAKNWSLLIEITPFLKGFTLFFWITGTWWIPLLFILMIWRYLYNGYPLSYEPQLWGMVFPLAMYTTSTYQLSVALDVPMLAAIPRIMVYISILAWITVSVSLLRHLFKSLKENVYYAPNERI